MSSLRARLAIGSHRTSRKLSAMRAPRLRANSFWRCDADCAAGKKLCARERICDAFERAHFRVDPESGLGNGGNKHQQCGEYVSGGKRPGRAGFDEMAEQHG